MGEKVIEVSCIRHVYEDGTEVDICGLDFVVERGRRVAVLGPNGAGKTTLLFHILGLLKAREGRIRVLGVDPAQKFHEIRERVGIVLQNVEEQIVAPTVYDDVAFSPRQYGMAPDEVDRRVRAVLERLGIEELASKVPHHLSGGEKRKVALAGALAVDPELLVLDEPFEGLDPQSREDSVKLIRELAGEGKTIVFTTHDVDTVPEVADHVYVLAQGGEIVLDGTPDQVFDQAGILARSNIRPPLLAQLFAQLSKATGEHLAVPCDVDRAVASLAEWRSRGTDS